MARPPCATPRPAGGRPGGSPARSLRPRRTWRGRRRGGSDRRKDRHESTARARRSSPVATTLRRTGDSWSRSGRTRSRSTRSGPSTCASCRNRRATTDETRCRAGLSTSTRGGPGTSTIDAAIEAPLTSASVSCACWSPPHEVKPARLDSSTRPKANRAPIVPPGATAATRHCILEVLRRDLFSEHVRKVNGKKARAASAHLIHTTGYFAPPTAMSRPQGAWAHIVAERWQQGSRGGFGWRSGRYAGGEGGEGTRFGAG